MRKVLAAIIATTFVYGYASPDASAFPVEFRLPGTITGVTGAPFGLSVGDSILMIAQYDTTDLVPNPANGGTGTGGDNCFDITSCPINFGSGEGVFWELRLDGIVLIPSMSDLADFPGLVFNNGLLDNIEGVNFVFGVNGSPASFLLGTIGDCPIQDFPCAFTGSDGLENSFSGVFADNYTQTRLQGEPPVTEPPAQVPEPSSLLLMGLGLVGLAWSRRRRA